MVQGGRMTELETLKYIVKNTLWMARRYATERQSYAPSLFNECVHKLDEVGLGDLHKPDRDIYNDKENRFANDGMCGIYDPETKTYNKPKEKAK